MCIFLGLMPASHGDEIRLVSAVGTMQGDLMIFKEVQEGITVRLEKEQEVTI